MKLIDLVPFAEHSKKIPGKFLIEKNQENAIGRWKILVAHLLDFAISFMITYMMAEMFNQSIMPLMVTNGLKSSFSEEVVIGLAVLFLPLILFSYFSFTYFMNHGQTCGMIFLKTRVRMDYKSFKDAIVWAGHSMFLCFSIGFSFLINQSLWDNVNGHDYLYQDLVLEKEISGMNLLSEIERFEIDKLEEEDFIKAA